MASQKWVTLIVVLLTAIVLGIEYTVKRWYPAHEQRLGDAALKQLPYQNKGLGIQMQVAAGIYGKVQDFPGGVKIYRPRLRGEGPSITITTDPNPGGALKFPDNYIAQLETAAENNGPSFEPVTINQRPAVLITQSDPRTKTTNITARILTPEQIVQAICNTGSGDQDVYTQACNESLNTIKIAGSSPSKPHVALYNLN